MVAWGGVLRTWAVPLPFSQSRTAALYAAKSQTRTGTSHRQREAGSTMHAPCAHCKSAKIEARAVVRCDSISAKKIQSPAGACAVGSQGRQWHNTIRSDQPFGAIPFGADTVALPRRPGERHEGWGGGSGKGGRGGPISHTHRPKKRRPGVEVTGNTVWPTAEH